MQPDGYVKIKDRSKDIIISGGENISSLEVEGTMYRHCAVRAAAVVAMRDAKWGEVPCAFIEPKQGLNPSEDE
jgi:fatty-acyl-CoA synthase